MRILVIILKGLGYIALALLGLLALVSFLFHD